MKSFEAITSTYNRSDDEVERDLYAVLTEVSGGEKAKISEANYKYALRVCLINKNCIEEVGLGYSITEEGERILKRGWIAKDYKTLKIKEKRELLIKYWTLGAALATAIATLITAILTIFKNA